MADGPTLVVSLAAGDAMSNGVWTRCAGSVAVLLFGAAVRNGARARRLRRYGVLTRGASLTSYVWLPVIEIADQEGDRVEFMPRRGALFLAGVILIAMSG